MGAQLNLLDCEPVPLEPSELEARGNCYVASEALYHLLGGKAAGWTPCSIRSATEVDVHWYLRHSSGLILDATVSQFMAPPDYSRGRGRGFLTSAPSRRAEELADAIVWGLE